MTEKAVKAAPAQLAHPPTPPPADGTRPAPSPQDAALKKKKKLLNGASIKFTFPSGATYEGSFKDGKIEGYGVYTYAQTGDVYAGEWKADLKHGQGTYKFANGDRYVGQWYMGNKHGKGRFSFANGDEYVGSWRDNQMNGYGSFHLAENGDRYDGYWKGGLREGRGTLRHGNGDLYDGEWENGQQHGIGVFCQSNNDLYCGDWSGGVMDGKGILREKGLVFLVEYVGGYLISKLQLPEAGDDIDDDWVLVYQHYLKWVEENEASKRPETHPGEETKLKDELEAAHAEISIVRKRLDDAMQLLLIKTRSVEATADTSAAALGAAKEALTAAYWREKLQSTEAKVKLLECTLAERVMEIRKLSDRVNSSDAKLKELELDREAAKAKRKTVSKKRTSHPPKQDAEPVQDGEVSFSEEYCSAEELATLTAQHATLLQFTEELQRKCTFLSSENAKLTVKHEAAEEQYEKLEDELAELRLQLQAPSAISPSALADEKPLKEMPTLDSEPPEPLSLAATAAMDTEELQRRLIKANQLTIELRLRNDHLQRVLERREGKGDSRAPNAALEGLTSENETLRRMISQLNKQLTLLQDTSDSAEQRLFVSTQREAELEAAMRTITKEKAADPRLQRVLEDKSDKIAKLELENAELARLLDETQVTITEKGATTAKAKRPLAVQPSKSDDESAELAHVERELKKVQKRLKKVTAERNTVAEQFYDSQLQLARSKRALGALHGQLMVFASLSETEASAAVPVESIVRIDETDPSTMILTDCGEDVVYKLDYCFGKDATALQVFSEMHDALAFVWSGFQFGVVTVGELRSGKTTLVKNLFPLFVQSILRAAEMDPQAALFSHTYRVAVAEVSSRGGFDCASEESFSDVCHDASGYVRPRNARFIDCTSVSIAAIVENLLSKRRQSHSGRSHTWIQLQCVRTGLVQQTQTVGRVTFFDWCGPGPLSLQKIDIESARFANTSSQAIKDLSSALSASSPAVPYTKSLETSLLYDLLGGNAMTAVVGRLRPSPEHVEESLRTLSVLSALTRARNGPLLQDSQTCDEIRWRGLVAALSSDDQAERELVSVDNARAF